MSADNWGICPGCIATLDKQHTAAVEAAEKAYGKVPAAEYLKLREAADKKPMLPEESLREDYELGIYRTNEGTMFKISYSARCVFYKDRERQSGGLVDGCGFKFTFKHEEPVK